MTTPEGAQIDVVAYGMAVEFQYGDYRSKPQRGGTVPLVTEPGFIAFEIPAWKAIAISPPGVQTVAEQLQLGIKRTTQLIRTSEPASGGSTYDRSLWQIAYRELRHECGAAFSSVRRPEGIAATPGPQGDAEDQVRPSTGDRSRGDHHSPDRRYVQ